LKLIIDIGNTLFKLALFDGKNLAKESSFSRLDINIVASFVNGIEINHAILSSVRLITDDILNVIKCYNILVLDSNINFPIKIKYKNIDSLGKDRLAAVVGAYFLYPQRNILILDIGTCLTIDFINKEKEYIGGRISPGINMRYAALHHFTEKLPLCQKVDSQYFIGNDTASSIQSGVQQGIISELDVVIDSFKQENKDIIVIATGGDCFFFEKALKNTIFADQFLVMRGLNDILDYNV
tara:strand:- start:569 stop:1285 length:717 start_codon:yes stop_codon:yes gene_type:complete